MILLKMDVNCQKQGKMQTNFNLSRPFPNSAAYLFSSDSSLELSVSLGQFWQLSSPQQQFLTPQRVFALSLSSQGVFIKSWPVIRIIRHFSLKLFSIKVLTTCLTFLLYFICFIYLLYLLYLINNCILHYCALTEKL